MNRHTPIPLTPSKRSVLSRTLGGLLREVARIAKALEHRREVRHLAELDERTLKDIGLSRSEVDGALAEPLYRDPSLVLVRSVERRMRLRAVSPETKRPRPVVPLVNGARCA